MIPRLGDDTAVITTPLCCGSVASSELYMCNGNEQSCCNKSSSSSSSLDQGRVPKRYDVVVGFGVLVTVFEKCVRLS